MPAGRPVKKRIHTVASIVAAGGLVVRCGLGACHTLVAVSGHSREYDLVVDVVVIVNAERVRA